MIYIQLTCEYCGTKWQLKVASKYDVEYAMKNLKCGYCGQKDISAKDITQTKVDYYGSGK